MKSRTELSLWNIIERLQRQLERSGVSAAHADRTIALAVRHLTSAR